MSTKVHRGFGRRVNQWLEEPAGETFKDGKWRFWFPALIGFSILNAALTALVFAVGDNLQTYMGSVLLGVGALLAWLGVGALHYSDSYDSRLARGVSALDSVTLIFVIAHFCFLLWVYGRVSTLQSTEADYKASAEKFNAEARQVSTDNVKIAEAARAIAAETTKAERLRNDTIYQTRKAAEAGARISGGRSNTTSAIAPSISTAPIELERPTKPAESSTKFLTEWDWWVRVANFGELALAAITLIFIRNRTAKTNARSYQDFPSELDADVVQERHSRPRFDRTRKSDRATTVVPFGDSFDRKAARRKLLDHLRVISHYNPGKWFKADLIEGGVHIRLCARVNTIEETIADTRQSDKLLATVYQPDFRARLIEELIYQGFPIERAGQ